MTEAAREEAEQLRRNIIARMDSSEVGRGDANATSAADGDAAAARYVPVAEPASTPSAIKVSDRELRAIARAGVPLTSAAGSGRGSRADARGVAVATPPPTRPVTNPIPAIFPNSPPVQRRRSGVQRIVKSQTAQRGRIKVLKVSRSASRHKVCNHGRRANLCKECYELGGIMPSRLCSHGRQKMHCHECPRPLCWCQHNRQRSTCKECKP